VISRIEEAFRKLKRKGKKAFIPYIMAGDPSLERTKDVVLVFEECGADIVELGVPFTDPLADGPTIQRASERALKAGVTLKKVIAFVKNLRKSTQIPVVLMTYYNPVFKYGEESFVRDAKDAGVDGVIVPDLPHLMRRQVSQFLQEKQTLIQYSSLHQLQLLKGSRR